MHYRTTRTNMRTSITAAGSRPSFPVAARNERRSRTHLRDLCDEVLASYRAASCCELISEAERTENRAFLANFTPLIGN